MGRKPFSKRLDPLCPNTTALFKKHCEDGWSPHSFTRFIKGGEVGYYKALAEVKEFRQIKEFFTPEKFNHGGIKKSARSNSDLN